MGINRKEGEVAGRKENRGGKRSGSLRGRKKGAGFLVVLGILMIAMAAVVFFAGKYAYHLLREYMEYAA